jgi:hypothetical protein
MASATATEDSSATARGFRSLLLKEQAEEEEEEEEGGMT